ncbi:MAG TPA: PAS domain S-box protein, partial [Oculatellaceae cyanobacterium]
MKLAIEKKMIIGGFGLGLFILSGVSIISYWSLIGVHPATSLPNPMLTVALGNSLSLMILGWVYFLYSSLITRKCPFYEATGEADAIGCVSHDITDRKRAELEQERFFNLSLDMLAIANDDGYFTYLNPAWERTLGFTLEELKAQPFIEFIHPEDVETTQAEIEEHRKGIHITQFENRYRCKDGSYKWLSWTSVPFLEEGLIYGVAHDISDKKQAEAALQKANEELEIRVEERTAYLRQVNDELLAEIVDRTQAELALRKSESLYRTLVETIPHGIEEINTTGIITFGNSALHRMLGYAEGELLGKRIWELIPESDRITVPGYLAMLVQDQPSPPSYQGQALTKEGKVLDIQVDWDYKRDKQGQVTGFIAVITDITDIRTRKQELQALFEGSLDAIAIVDDRGKYVEVNPAFCELLGVPQSQILGHRIGNFIESSADIEQQWRILLQQGQATGELCLRHSDGTLRYVEYAAKASFVPGRHLAVVRDITQRKQAQEKIHFQARLLDVVQQAAMVTDLAGNIIYWNRYAEVLYGWSASEVLGRQVVDVTPTET